MADAYASEAKIDEGAPRQGKVSTAWWSRYNGSAAEDLFKRLGALDFGNWILIFGASLLLTILPVILLLSSLVSLRVDDDLARHLDLSRPGSVVFDGLFKSAPVKFDSGFVLSLIIGVAGAVGLSITVQILYERVFDQPHQKSLANVVRCAVWALVLAANLIADGAVSRALRGTPDRGVLYPAVAAVAGTLFFWWTMHFLLAGREPWGRLSRSAVTTAIFWVGLGVFSHYYLSSSMISDNKLYGSIGVVFDLVTWFIAIGAVLMLGAVIGAVWDDKRQRPRPQAQSTP
jgi:membrane protein